MTGSLPLDLRVCGPLSVLRPAFGIEVTFPTGSWLLARSWLPPDCITRAVSAKPASVAAHVRADSPTLRFRTAGPISSAKLCRHQNPGRKGAIRRGTLIACLSAFPSTTATRACPHRFYARARSDAGRRAAAGAGQPALAESLGLDPDCARRAARASRCSPATAFPRARSRSRSPMPATSSAASCRSSATAAPSCSARSSARDGKRRDIQLKGSGRTPFSRGGDGRAALGPVLREYIVSEAMAALGIPTTRALAAVTTGEPVCARRCCPARCSRASPRATSASARSSSSRRAATREALRLLADYAIARHYPDGGRRGNSPTSRCSTR